MLELGHSAKLAGPVVGQGGGATVQGPLLGHQEWLILVTLHLCSVTVQALCLKLCLARIIFMLFTQQQPLAVNLKSSFVNIIFLHFIKISNNGFRKKPYLLLHKNPRDDAGSFAHLILASWR